MEHVARSRFVVAVASPEAENSALHRARELRERGDEVIYLGVALTPEQVAASVIAEDANQVLVDSPLVQSVSRVLVENDADDIEVRALR